MSSLADIIDRASTWILDDLGLNHSHEVRTETSSSSYDTNDKQFYDICDFYISYDPTSPHNRMVATKTPIESRKPDQIKDVIFDKQATTIIWANGEKTTVKAFGEPIDHEKGLAMALAKRVLTNDRGEWKSTFTHILDAAEKHERNRIINKAMVDIRKAYTKSFDVKFDKLLTEALAEKEITLQPNEVALTYLSVPHYLDIFNVAHKTAYESVVRRRKQYISMSEGVDSEMLDSEYQDAIANYYHNRLTQMVVR